MKNYEFSLMIIYSLKNKNLKFTLEKVVNCLTLFNKVGMEFYKNRLSVFGRFNFMKIYIFFFKSDKYQMLYPVNLIQRKLRILLSFYIQYFMQSNF